MAKSQEPGLRDVLHALADDTRLEIVRRLAEADGDLACSVLYDDVAKSTASYHFALLRVAGVLTQYERGGQKLNHLETAAMERIAPGVLPAVLATLHTRSRGAERASAPRA